MICWRESMRAAHGTIVSSNTSGIPIGLLAEGRSDDFRRHWLGTHFFNPPRYLHLLEVIPTARHRPAASSRPSARLPTSTSARAWCIAKDTPNFIGNHLALYGVMRMLEKVASGEFTIEEVDAITGPAIGRPKSATFRTLDLAGVDILGHVVRNLHERLPDDEATADVRAAGVRRADARSAAWSAKRRVRASTSASRRRPASPRS